MRWTSLARLLLIPAVLLLAAGSCRADFSLSLSPTSLSIVQGSSDTVAVTINRTGGFTGAVELSLEDTPAGVTASFTPNPAVDNSTLTLEIAATAETGTRNLTVRGVSGNRTARATLNLTITSVPTGVWDGSEWDEAVWGP